MKLLPIVFALAFLSMTEGANLRSVQKQASVVVVKGSESPIEGSLRQILDDNNDEAWGERELKKKKSVKAKVRQHRSGAAKSLIYCTCHLTNMVLQLLPSSSIKFNRRKREIRIIKRRNRRKRNRRRLRRARRSQTRD